MVNSRKGTQKDRSDFLAVLLCAVFFCALLFVVIYKYLHFGYYDWDLAFFSQAAWNLTHGSQYASLVGINFFGDHSYFIMFLVLPIFYAFPHPLTLVILKVLCYILAGYMLYKIGKKEAGGSFALIFMFLYFIFPANLFSLLYEFNTEGLAPPLLFAMFYFFKERRLKLYYLFALLVFCIKENMALLILMFSIYALFDKPRNKFSWSILPAVLAMSALCILVIYVIPYYRGLENHPFLVRYSYLGHSIGEVIKTLLTQPLYTTKLILRQENLNFMSELFGPLLIPAFLSPAALLIVSPILLQHFLSSQIPEHTIYYHYGATLVPFIFLSALSTLKLIQAKFSGKFVNTAVIFLATLCMAQTFSYSDSYKQKIDYHGDRTAADRWQLIKQIPKDAAVIASFDFLAELSTRKELYSFHKIYSDSYQSPQEMKKSELYVGKAFKLPQHVTYALIDFNDPWISGSAKYNYTDTTSRIRKFLYENDWTIEAASGSIVLMRRNPS